MMESILLFSLAILIIAVGLLVYYFKKRIADVEHKSSKSLEIVHDLYMEQMNMKKNFNAIIQSLQDEDDDPDQDQQPVQEPAYESIQEPAYEIKTVNVDLSLPNEDMIEVTHDDEFVDDEPADEDDEQPELEEEDHIVVTKIDNPDQSTQSVSKDDLKKMTPSTLKSLIISKGVSPEVVHKMKKNELIDLLLKL